ncbi:anoctamin-5-like isoform X1 [Brachionus plicatilis]|uniref:Anoctamin n=1 Tax=Brachionus plicatilis TaxID=10195 RepID=A0A3M7SNZ5_BRAPC|nr:anoctamin-5-like isoform X1 [Brachionus plicatilis]
MSEFRMDVLIIEQKDFDFKNVEQIDFILFASTFSLGPLIVLVINVIDLRIDGAWFHIIRFLNIAGIVSNAFIIAFTSNWSKSFLNGTLENRLIFVVAFEHIVFVIWLLIIILFPDIPQSIAVKIRTEAKLVKKIISENKVMPSEKNGMFKSLQNNENKVMPSEKNGMFKSLQNNENKVMPSEKNGMFKSLQYNENKVMPSEKNGMFKSLQNNENKQPDLDILSNSSDLKKDSMQSAPDPNYNTKVSNEINCIDVFKINEQTRKRRRKNKKYLKLVSKIWPVVENFLDNEKTIILFLRTVVVTGDA